MPKYKAQYIDNKGITETIINNDFKTISLNINGITFSGSEFSDLRITNKNKYSKSELERFSFLEIPFKDSEKTVKTLCNCSFIIEIPVILIDLTTKTKFKTELTVNYILGKARPEMRGIEKEEIFLNTEINNKKYSGKGDVFETAFDNLSEKFEKNYKFKNCYGCMYADYSVYGQSSLGTMRCYENQKETYLSIKSKEDYITKLSENYKTVQEFFLCDKFKIRKKGIGYRE